LFSSLRVSLGTAQADASKRAADAKTQEIMGAERIPFL
jgi:hypothetical protein